MTVAIDYLLKNPNSVIGLNIAVQDFTQAWMQHSSEALLLCHSAEEQSQQHFMSMASNLGIKTVERCGVLNPIQTPERLHQIDCLFVPDPNLSTPMWRRAHQGASHALCGLVHSMSGEQVNRAVSDLCTMPTRPFDALICPSIAIRDVVLKLWETNCDYLSHHFGKKIASQVQTPIIPIGIDTEAFTNRVTPAKREEQRKILNADEDEVIVLFVGRLNFATKAHPLPLLLALREAAQQTNKNVRLIFYGYFMPEEEMRKRFKSIVKDFTGDKLICEIIENTDNRFPEGCLAAADIFTSLVDNVQESFGLTPIEAMACGLPVVATDWDGYRDGIEHGSQGYLIPTSTPPESAGLDIASHYLSDHNYGNFLMGAAQSTAIDISAATESFLTLINDPQKRKEMGDAGKKKARENYDWSVIIPAYEKLWAELSSMSKDFDASHELPTNWPAITPTFPNPYHQFSSFPSYHLTPSTRLSIKMKDDEILRLLTHDMNYFLPTLLAPKPLIFTLIEAIRAHESIAISDILAIAPELEHQRLWRTIGWFLKHGICRKIDG